MPTKAKSLETPLLECRNLNKSFDDKIILSDISFKVPRGKIIGLLGKNGAGKTTLIKLCNDLLTPTSGEILFDGKPLSVKSKEQVAYLPERTYLDKSMHIKDAIKFFATFYNDFDTEKAEKLLQILDLKPEMRIANMSKGMQEKLQLILVISRNAKLYILDERITYKLRTLLFSF